MEKGNGLVNIFLYDIQRYALVLVQKLNRPQLPFALPGGVVENGETILQAALREAKEEVGEQASEAVKKWQEQIVIDKGNYKQNIFIVPFSNKLRKEGMEEKTKSGLLNEVLGAPVLVSFNEVKRGIVQQGGNKYSKIYRSHMNAIHECMAMLAETDPDTFASLSKATRRFAFEKTEIEGARYQ